MSRSTNTIPPLAKDAQRFCSPDKSRPSESKRKRTSTVPGQRQISWEFPSGIHALTQKARREQHHAAGDDQGKAQTNLKTTARCRKRLPTPKWASGPRERLLTRSGRSRSGPAISPFLLGPSRGRDPYFSSRRAHVDQHNCNSITRARRTHLPR